MGVFGFFVLLLFAVGVASVMVLPRLKGKPGGGKLSGALASAFRPKLPRAKEGFAGSVGKERPSLGAWSPTPVERPKPDLPEPRSGPPIRPIRRLDPKGLPPTPGEPPGSPEPKDSPAAVPAAPPKVPPGKGSRPGPSGPPPSGGAKQRRGTRAGNAPGQPRPSTGDDAVAVNVAEGGEDLVSRQRKSPPERG